MLILDTSALQMQMNGMIIVAFFITCSTEVLIFSEVAYSIACILPMLMIFLSTLLNPVHPRLQRGCFESQHL